MSEPNQVVLLYFIIPLWLLAGFADWLCHRKSNIASTAGLKESLIHLLMFAEVGLPLLLAMFFEINALVILIAIVCFFLHEATALWDVSYVKRKREISAIEQHIHSFLEIIPLMALVLIVSSHWQAFLSLWGASESSPVFAFFLKSPPLSITYITLFISLIVMVVILPFTEEFIRYYKAKGQPQPNKNV